MSEKFNGNQAIDRIGASWKLFQTDLVMFALVIFIGLFLSAITLGILSGPIMIGIYKTAVKMKKGEKAEIGDVFSGMKKFLPSFVTFLLVGLVALAFWLLFAILFALFAFIGNYVAFLGGLLAGITGLVAFVAGILLAVALGVTVTFALILISEEDLGAVAALKKAANWVKANLQIALEYFFATFICSLAGMIPVVGTIAATGLSSLTLIHYYDAEKEAGRL